MKTEIKSPEQYIDKLPEDRKKIMERLRDIILRNIPEGFAETISYGMIGYVVPKIIYPEGYHVNPEQPLPFMSIASQKNYVSLYHSGIYSDEKLKEWFVNEYMNQTKTKPDMGKSCIRFKKPEKIPFDLIAELVTKVSAEKWIKIYESHIKR